VTNDEMYSMQIHALFTSMRPQRCHNTTTTTPTLTTQTVNDLLNSNRLGQVTWAVDLSQPQTQQVNN